VWFGGKKKSSVTPLLCGYCEMIPTSAEKKHGAEKLGNDHGRLKTRLRYWSKDAGRISNEGMRNPRLSAALPLAMFAQEIDN